MTEDQMCRSSLARALGVANLLQDLHQDDGDKHAYGDAARLHSGEDPDALDHDVPQAYCCYRSGRCAMLEVVALRSGTARVHQRSVQYWPECAKTGLKQCSKQAPLLTPDDLDCHVTLMDKPGAHREPRSPNVLKSKPFAAVNAGGRV